jgi:hypothetical protein
VFEIEELYLEPYEIKVIGFLWETFPLPPEKLLLRKFDKSEVFLKNIKIV